MTPTFSLLHASFGRPAKAILAMRSWFDRASRPQDIEYIFSLNFDDPTRGELMALLGEYAGKYPARIITDNFAGSAPAWQAAAEASEGLVMIQASDDVVPPQFWDDSLGVKMFDARPSGPFVIAVSDGFRKDALLTVAIASRDRYEQCGKEFLHSGYVSMYSDDEFTIRAAADSADGKCAMIDARDIEFRHAHHYHNPQTVPWDATYAKQNHESAYALGRALFEKRNAAAIERGLKTWV